MFNFLKATFFSYCIFMQFVLISKSSLLGGAIRLLEENYLNRAVLWVICLLHTNELPFKKYFKWCDNSGKDVKTTSPSYDGHIGKNFKDGLDLEEIVNFNKVKGKVPVFSPDFIKSFNNDTKYLYQICHAIQDGPKKFPKHLIKKLIGHCHQGR